MSMDTEVTRVVIVGTGIINASWAAIFLAHGVDVVVTDPARPAEEALRRYIEAAWATLAKTGVAAGASQERLSFNADLRETIASADYVLWCRDTAPSVSIA